MKRFFLFAFVFSFGIRLAASGAPEPQKTPYTFANFSGYVTNGAATFGHPGLAGVVVELGSRKDTTNSFGTYGFSMFLIGDGPPAGKCTFRKFLYTPQTIEYGPMCRGIDVVLGTNALNLLFSVSTLKIGAIVSDASGTPVVGARILDANGKLLGETKAINAKSNAWDQRSFILSVPVGTKSIFIEKTGYLRKEVDILKSEVKIVLTTNFGSLLRFNPDESKANPVTKSAPVASAPKIWAFVVGVERYRQSDMNLKYSKIDALKFASFLTSVSGLGLPDEQVVYLLDERATRQEILKKLRSHFAKAGPNDMAIFYFSGHGKPGFFCPYDSDDSDLNLIQHTEIREMFDNCRAKNKLLIADACFSGSFTDAKPGQAVEKTLDIFNRDLLKSKGGFAVLTSSKDNETSREGNDQQQQGLFSYYILKGLGGAADTNRDHLVTIQELFNYIQPKVYKESQSAQKPTLSGKYDPGMPLSHPKN